MSELGVALFAVLTGYATAGLTQSLYALVTGRALRFRIRAAGDLARLADLAALVLAGPAVLLDTAFAPAKGRASAGPTALHGLAIGVFLFWSFLLGLFVLQIVISVTR